MNKMNEESYSISEGDKSSGEKKNREREWGQEEFWYFKRSDPRSLPQIPIHPQLFNEANTISILETRKLR